MRVLRDEEPATIVDRARDLRSNMSAPEVLLWTQLRGRTIAGLKFRRQHPVGRYVLDFYCPAAKLVIEIDGEGHGVGDQPDRDERRDAWLKSQGLHVMRIPASDVMADVAAVADAILMRIGEDPPIVAHRRSRGSPATLPPASGGKSE
ncbi:MAG TPA: endonuclease domain-containing protein [Caulobacteraceae bacterium]|nr:endonuclease domain-containing protein [Caulobacteraceae bacterium]